jgi:hypothetical protein
VNDLAATVNELALTVNELAAKVVVDAARFNNDAHLRVNVLETMANLRGPPLHGKATPEHLLDSSAAGALWEIFPHCRISLRLASAAVQTCSPSTGANYH